MKRIILLLSTGFGVGYSPIMPGTMGTIVAVILFLFASVNVYVFYSVLFFLLFVSVPVSGKAEKIMGKIDPGAVVIDEILGFFVTMIGFRISWGHPILDYKYVFFGFLLFRFFDIVKPWPIKSLQKLKAGWGIVVDDVVAGIFARLILQIIWNVIK